MNLLSSIARAFYSCSFYGEVAHTWKGAALGYLSALVLIASLVTSVQAHVSFADFKKTTPQFINQMPDITIQNGKLRTPERRPYAVYEANAKEPVILIDTTYEGIPLDKPWQMFASESLFVARKSNGTLRAFELSRIKSLTLDQAFWEKWLNVLSGTVGGIVFPFIFAGFLIGRLFQIFLISLVSFLALKIGKSRLTYAAVFRVTAVAMTAAVFFDLARQFVGPVMPFGKWIGTFLAAGYVVFGLFSAAKTPDADNAQQTIDPGL